jgi:H+/Cl- antiporter ClcA
MSKISYRDTSKDYDVRGTKAFFAFMTAASVLFGAVAVVAHKLYPEFVSAERSRIPWLAALVVGIPLVLCLLSQTARLKGNGHGPIRRLKNCMFNPDSYKGGMIHR